MKKIIFLLCFLLVVSQFPSVVESQKTEIKSSSINQEIDDMLENVNESTLYHYLENLIKIGPRFTGSDNCRKAAEYIDDEFKNMGLYSYIQPWEYIRRKCQNVVATLNGTDNSSDAVFIICAHYDTITSPYLLPTKDQSVGANDNGGGVASIMTIAKLFSESSFNNTIKFIAFSGEEVGCFGSLYYAKEAYENDENIVAVLNLDTIGTATTGKEGNNFKLWVPERSRWIYDFVGEICKKYQEFFDLQAHFYPTFGCDHGSFIKYGYDGVLFSEYEYSKYFHSAEDTIDKINFTYLEKVTKCVLATLYELENNPIDIQVRFVNPREGYFHIFDSEPIRMPFFNSIRFRYSGLTFILGRTTAKVEVKSKEDFSRIDFVLDGEYVFIGNSSNITEWVIRGFMGPLVGRHTLAVYAYNSSGKVSYDEMDLFIVSPLPSFRPIFPRKQ